MTRLIKFKNESCNVHSEEQITSLLIHKMSSKEDAIHIRSIYCDDCGAFEHIGKYRWKK